MDPLLILSTLLVLVIVEYGAIDNPEHISLYIVQAHVYCVTGVITTQE